MTLNLLDESVHSVPPPPCSVETFQSSATFGEEDGPPEEWLWPEFNSLDQEEDEEEPPTLPRTKEEQELLWIGLEGGQEFTGAPHSVSPRVTLGSSLKREHRSRNNDAD